MSYQLTGYRKLNNLLGWLVFVISAIVFLLTLEPTASWWDPGEFISTSYKLQVGHPPGAPTMQMIARLFSLLAFGNTSKVALMINAMSGICSAFAVLFLFWTITIFARKIVAGKGEMTRSKMYTIFAAGLVGALTFTFTDSFWFSAVEGEVYAMSAMFTALVFWSILKWEEEAGRKQSGRRLVFIAFMTGLAIGVHLLSLLTIPAVAFIIYFKRYRTSWKGILLTLVFSILLLAFIMYIVIPWIPELAGKVELLFVNKWRMPFNSGLISYFLVIITLIIFGLIFTKKKGKPLINTIILCFAFLLIGYSSFLMLVIRSNAGTPVNENAPDDMVSLANYLNREQYGTWPLITGPYYNAPVIKYVDGKPVYKRDKKAGRYVVMDDMKGTIPVYDPRFTTIFPRMWSNERRGSEQFFKNWGGEGVPVKVINEDGKPVTLNRPTFLENLKYFLQYQVGVMYLRYFMWNFAGRQNDVQGYGGPQNGNWISGIPFLDKWITGHPQTHMPDSMKNRGTNKYYMLPFILGLTGFFFQMKKEYRGTIILTLLFIMTGLAIVVYLNQKPFEPRERDYSYCGSTFAFSIWIGLGVICLINGTKKILKRDNLSVVLVLLLCLILVPGIMAEENWDDHDRSGKYSCRDYAANYLNSCDRQGILFTNGDNDTFPLWYDQEVEGIRTDVRVVNLALASGYWYIDGLFKKSYESEPCPFAIPHEKYQPGINEIIPYYDIGVNGYMDLKELVDFIKSDDPDTYLTLQNGEKMKFFPSKKVKLAVDTAACLKYGIVPEYLAGKMVDTICWTIRSNQLYKNDVMLLDLIANNNWRRPLYFVSPSSVNYCFNVDTFCFVQGWVYKFMPVKAAKEDYIPNMGGVDPLTSYDLLMNKFAWGNMNDPHVYVDPESLSEQSTPKNNMYRTAQSLMNIGKYDEAIRLMDKYFILFPGSKYPYDMFTIPYAELYYKAGEPAKANKIMERIGQIYAQNLDYYYTISGRWKEYYSDDIEQSLGVLRRLFHLAQDNKQTILANDLDQMFQKELKKYQ
jgi:tetratricopeptide (TPR) repeat protein